MEWNRSYSVKYSCRKVDPISFIDGDEIDILNLSINRSDSYLIESASMDVNEEIGEQYVRIYMTATQDGETTTIPIFTGLTSTPKRDINGNLNTYPVELYSVLKPADDILLQRGWYAPIGLSGISIIKRLLEPCHCPIEVDDESPSLTYPIIAEDGETNLTMINQILYAMDWKMKIFGDGTVHLSPNVLISNTQFDSLTNDIIEPSVSESLDWFSCPNVFRAVYGDYVAVARDDSEDSIFSTVSRGREIWAEDTNAQLSDGESLADYASRMLTESQSAYRSITYTRRFTPDLTVGDIVKINYPKQNLVGFFMITSQSISLGDNPSISEDVVETNAVFDSEYILERVSE
ncbi:MAG: hypothetical protein HUJ63_11870 [Enterococcus sp.]|nr:hypothetical protein [Enterococcus sp.]